MTVKIIGKDQNEEEPRPVIDVMATEEILRMTVVFIDTIRQRYGVKGMTLCLAMDVGEGRIAMKPIHTGVSLGEARLMSAYQHNKITEMIEAEDRQREAGNLN